MSAISALPVANSHPGLDYSAVKQRQQATWASGDFSVVAARILYQAEQLCETADLQAGWRVLDEAYQRELFGDSAASVTSYPRTAIFRYRSAEENVDFFRTYYGPTRRAFDALPAERRAALNSDMIALVHRYDRNAGTGPVAIAADYLETVITRK